MNLTSFPPKKEKRCKTRTTVQSTSDLSPKPQTSEISLKTSDLMLKHQKWQNCSPSTVENHLGFTKPSSYLLLDAIVCLKHLCCVIIKTLND